MGGLKVPRTPRTPGMHERVHRSYSLRSLNNEWRVQRRAFCASSEHLPDIRTLEQRAAHGALPELGKSAGAMSMSLMSVWIQVYLGRAHGPAVG